MVNNKGENKMKNHNENIELWAWRKECEADDHEPPEEEMDTIDFEAWQKANRKGRWKRGA